MDGNHWQFPVTFQTPFQIDPHLPIPPRPVPPWRQRPRSSSYLQTQYELSQPTIAPDPYAHPKSDINAANQSRSIFLSLMRKFRNGAAFAFKVLLSCLANLIHYLLKLPLTIFWNTLASLDWWLVFAFFFAVILSPLTTGEGLEKEDAAQTLAGCVEYVLAEDARRWGRFKSASSPFKHFAYLCFQPFRPALDPRSDSCGVVSVSDHVEVVCVSTRRLLVAVLSVK